MEIEVRKEEALIIKLLEKSLEASNSRDFKTKLLEFINQGQRMIILNLSQVEFIDSSGLGTLISILKLLANHQGNISICEMQEPVKRTFNLTRLNQVFSVYSTEEECLKASQKISASLKT